MADTEISLNEKRSSFLCTSKPDGKAIVLVGPTASGKSGLALELAEQTGGIIINADSMQVYADVPTLTARPGGKELERAEHRLYGFLNDWENCSAAKWADLAAEEMRRAWKAGKLPILTGGTGLYIRALQEGFSSVPEVPEDVRRSVRRRFDEIGVEAFRAEMRQKDSTIRLTDPQRLLRAAEILEATGKPLSFWQSGESVKVIDASWFNIFVNPERESLYSRCNHRFEVMMRRGAVEEVEILLAKNPPPDSLILKAIGVREIGAYLAGQSSRDGAVSKAQQATRNYAKRQVTWFRHRFRADLETAEPNSAEILTKVLHFLA